MNNIRFLLWDFGDTLADQTWMWPSPAGLPGWTPRFRALVDSPLDEGWLRGEVSTEELAAIFATDLGTTPEFLLTHIEARCRDIQFFEHAWTAAKAHVLPQAIVTVNPDLFSTLIVPNYALADTFDVIVTSWEEHTVDKARLCEIALDRLGGHDAGAALLLDNVEDNVDGWRACGGQGYVFRSDAEFARDAPLARFG